MHGEEKEEFEREGTVGDDDDAPGDVSWDSHWEGKLRDHNPVTLLVSFSDEDRRNHCHRQPRHHFLQVYWQTQISHEMIQNLDEEG